MADARARRRLAAILAADVVGYSRLMERNTLGRKHGSLAVEVSHSWKIGDIDGAA